MDVQEQQYSYHAQSIFLEQELPNCTLTMFTCSMDYPRKSSVIETQGSPHTLEKHLPND